MPILDLTFHELAVLEYLRYNYLVGSQDFRRALEEKFDNAIWFLTNEEQKAISEMLKRKFSNFALTDEFSLGWADSTEIREFLDETLS